MIMPLRCTTTASTIRAGLAFALFGLALSGCASNPLFRPAPAVATAPLIIDQLTPVPPPVLAPMPAQTAFSPTPTEQKGYASTLTALPPR